MNEEKKCPNAPDQPGVLASAASDGSLPDSGTTQLVVHVSRDGSDVFRLAVGSNVDQVLGLMCGRDDIASVIEALQDAVSFCKIDDSRLDERDGMGDVGSAAG